MHNRKSLYLLFIICIFAFILAALFYWNNLLDRKYKTEENQKINEYDQFYAGAFIDDEGRLHVNVVEGTDAEEVIGSKYRNAIIHYVKFSLKDLENIYEVLSDKMIELGISSIAVNEKENKVDVYINELDETNINRIKEVIDSPAIVFKERDIKFNINW